MWESETSTFTYLLADETNREAVLIDPVLETTERDLKLVNELNLKLRFVLETHVHADHVTGAANIREKTGAHIGVSRVAGAHGADLLLDDGDEVKFGNYTLGVLATPGHTDSCLSYFIGDRVFTGDALLIRGNGRTDFQQGSATRLFDSITKKLFALPDDTLVFPAHDYRGHTHSTIGLEKRFNPRVGGEKTLAQFVEIMASLNLPPPKKLALAVPANLLCGEV